MKSFALDLCFSDTLRPKVKPTAHVFRFRDVKNASALKSRLVGKDKTADYAMIDAKLVIDIFQVLLAATRALHDEVHSSMKTHGLHSEVVYGMSPTSSISDALRRFGISDTTTDLVVVQIGGEDPKLVQTEVTALVEGEEIDIEAIGNAADFKVIQKYYKLNDLTRDGKKVSAADVDRSELVDAVVGVMSQKHLA